MIRSLFNLRRATCLLTLRQIHWSLKIEEYAQLGQFQNAVNLLNKALEKGCDVNTKVANSMLLAAIKSSKINNIIYVIHECIRLRVSLDKDFWESILQFLIDRNDMGISIAVYEIMRENGIKPSIEFTKRLLPYVGNKIPELEYANIELLKRNLRVDMAKDDSEQDGDVDDDTLTDLMQKAKSRMEADLLDDGLKPDTAPKTSKGPKLESAQFLKGSFFVRRRSGKSLFDAYMEDDSTLMGIDRTFASGKASDKLRQSRRKRQSSFSVEDS